MEGENDDASFEDTADVNIPNGDGIVLDAGREVRAKLYLGRVRAFYSHRHGVFTSASGLHGMAMVHPYVSHAATPAACVGGGAFSGALPPRPQGR